MSCYHPLVGIWKGEHNEDTGKRRYEIHGNLDPHEVQILYPGSVTIPCGRCIGCKIQYSRDWADRMMIELDQYNGKGIFLTLTYNNDHVPCNYDPNTDEFTGFTLDKRDVQLFMKRLRKHYKDVKCRFYLAGEYGPSTLRPHYHAIIYGLSLEDLEKDGFKGLKPKGYNELKQQYWISPTLTKIWNNGFTLVSEVSWKTCAYVARYVTKKLGKEIELINPYAIPEFALMSRKPGIGGTYLEDHPEVYDLKHINMSFKTGGLQINIPKYFMKRLQLTNPVRYDNMMKERRMLADDRMYLKLKNTSLTYLDQLEVEENQKITDTVCLRRDGIERISFNLY